MAPTRETEVRSGSPHRRLRRRAQQHGPARPSGILTEYRKDDGELIGPYEMRYDLCHGYGVDRVIVRP
ncbi:MAG: hypothetical protein WEE89_13480 [Gemmatimonadota bacterium]|jgi:hypothetical protein